MSVVSSICDAIATELTTNVATLASALSAGTLEVHKYTPASLENAERDGRSHLAVWPSPVPPFADVTGATTASHNHTHRYQVLYWEPSDEAETGEASETKATTIFTLADAIITRFYITANQTLGSGVGQWRLWIDSWTPDVGGASGVRGLEFVLSAQVTYTFA